MSVRRVMGTETEYAVSAPGQGRYNPVQLSFDVVGAASDAVTQPYPLGLPAGRPRQRRARHQTGTCGGPPRTRSHRRPTARNITVRVIAPNGGLYPRFDHTRIPKNPGAGNNRPLRSGAIRPAPAISSHARRRSQGKRDDGTENRAAPQQRRRQRSQLGHARKLHDAAVAWDPFDLVTRLMTTHFVSRQIFIGSGRV